MRSLDQLKEDALLMIRLCFATVFLLFCSTLSAQTEAFGVSLGQSTVEDLESQYTLEQIGDSDLSGGPVYVVSGDQIEFDQLKEIQIVFDDDSRAVGVMATFPQEKFDYLKTLLGEQYEVMSDETFEEVYRLVTFKDAETRIELDAPPEGDVAVVYLSPSFIAAIDAADAAWMKGQEEIEQQIEEENKVLFEVMEQEKALL